MQVSWKQISGVMIVLGTLGLGTQVIMNMLTLREQQRAISTMVEYAAIDVESAKDANKKLWDLHRRVVELERKDKRFMAEDQRLMAHIKWFVMRRSGTAELKRMEQAIETLEAL